MVNDKIIKKDGFHCAEDCPYLQIWEHPFYHHSAWCWRNLIDLNWHDFWIASCERDNAASTMEKVRHAGKTNGEEYVKQRTKNQNV